LKFSTAAGFASPLRKILTFPLWGPMRAMFGPNVLGESVVAVARRGEASDRLSSEKLWAA
jgi:hypothetical protein